MKRLLEPLGVECIDAREIEKQHPCRILCGWELKLYATLHSPFAQVLFLDADNGGLLRLESRENEGTTVTILLPRESQ